MSQELVLYKTLDENIRVEAILEEETIWLNQKQIAEVFGIDRTGVTKHINNIFSTGELKEKSNVQKLHIANSDRPVAFYNLDIILAVGYRVNSKRATEFRKWASSILKEYIIKGFALDDEKLKLNTRVGSKDYFRELLDRVREIRTSEKRLYQQLKDIYALSIDYNDDIKASMLFFATVQNKVHYAIAGKTSAEIIHDRVDHNKENMGLTTYAGQRITKKDVVTAKNYLEQGEIEELRLIVDMFLNVAELKTRRNQHIKMQDWTEELDKFMAYNGMEILKGAGKISRMTAQRKAVEEYKLYRELELEKELEESKLEYKEDIKILDKLIQEVEDSK